MAGSARKRVLPAWSRLCMQAAASDADIIFTWWCVREAGRLRGASSDPPHVQATFAVEGQNQAPPLGRRR
eukprot:4292086-Pleurochrysis_carterae.AAC.1